MEPSRRDVKAILFPSGDQTGSKSPDGLNERLLVSLLATSSTYSAESGYCEAFSTQGEIYTICLPSGDQSRLQAPNGILVNWRWSVPSELIVNICANLSTIDAKAISPSLPPRGVAWAAGVAWIPGVTEAASVTSGLAVGAKVWAADPVAVMTAPGVIVGRAVGVRVRVNVVVGEAIEIVAGIGDDGGEVLAASAEGELVGSCVCVGENNAKGKKPA